MRSSLVLALASVALCLLLAELAFRLVGFDFGEGQRAAYERRPIYYRQPRKPLPDYLFQRHGPATWTGRVLATGLRERGSSDDTYADEPEITVGYDAEGLRNPEDLDDWEIAVAGDSFVEAGYLPDEALMTSRLGQRLGVRVKNLGVSYSGPLTYTALLEHFGVAPGARHAVMVFFEGNDLDDLMREVGWRQDFEATGERGYREFEPRRSLLRALVRRLGNLVKTRIRRGRSVSNARFRALEGEVPVSVAYAPPGPDQVSERTRAELDRAFAEWSQTARVAGMEPWIVFMPAKRRVMDGRLSFVDGAPRELVEWQPNDLAGLIRRTAEANRARFVDLTPALVRETTRGRLVYNPVWDTHLNERGSQVAAGVLARALAGAR